jgi:hypothetical protein
VELAFEVKDVVMSVRALGSDDPVLEAPLPSPVQGLDFYLAIPLGGDEARWLRRWRCASRPMLRP